MRARRLLLLPALVLVYVLVAEAGLQIAAFFVRRTTRAEMPVAWVTGNVRVLCLGDSHTYGLWVDRSEAYPQQLESLWNQRTDSPKLEVLNVGVPGTNSSRLVRELPQMLEALDPDTLIIMVGGNDFWTLPVPLDDTVEAQPRESFLKRHSLLYRLYYLFQRGRQVSAPEIMLDPDATLTGTGRYQVRVGDQEIEMGYTAGASDLRKSLADLKRNLRRLVELARDGGRPLYLMTYPTKQNPFLTASMVIKAVAEETGTPLIDLTAVFARICPKRDCPETVFEDGHPKAPGYRIVAETIVERLARRGAS